MECLITSSPASALGLCSMQGAKKQFQKDGADWDDNKSAWVAAVVSGGLAVVTAVVVIPILKMRANKAMAK